MKKSALIKITIILALVLALGACSNSVDPNAPLSTGPTDQPFSGTPTTPEPK